VGKEFVFVSGNLKKVHWLETFLGKEIKHQNLDLKEIQSLDTEEVVKEKAYEAYRLLKQPVLIEDTTLRFNALGRLPGTFIKFFLQEIQLEGLCKLLGGYTDKSAVASVMYGIYDSKHFTHLGAEVIGTIADQPRGSGGHGWDPVFIPEEQLKTYAEMTLEEYAHYSVRNKAVKKLEVFLADD
jgi:non-canonical purine NTP pyrophosphatase (RdgB/HAM1 family)